MRPVNIKIYSKGQTIYDDDRSVLGFYYIHSGAVKIYSNEENGQEIILKLATSGDLIGHDFLSQQNNHRGAAKALEETVCQFVEVKNLDHFLIENPQLGCFLIKEMGKNLGQLQNRCIELIKKNVRERIASYFCYMADHYGENDGQAIRIKIQLSREEMASIVGTASETAIRFISEFKELGLITEERKHFYILDMERLAQIAKISSTITQ